MIGQKTLKKNYGFTVTDMNKPIQLPKQNKIVINSKNYITNGESLIVVKDVDFCKIILNPNTTEYIVIKAMTKVSISHQGKKIDETYDEIVMDKGSSVEFCLVENVYYIIASDGLKLE
jgi:hypothetical protein